VTGEVFTAVGLPVIGVVLFAVGWWGRRQLEVLVGTLGSPDLLERRRETMGRGALACMVGGAILLVGGVALGIVAIL